MTSATDQAAPDGTAPDETRADAVGDGADRGPGGRASDPFAQDVLPAPRNAQLTLLRSLLRPHSRRVWLATVLLLVQQAAVQAGPLLVAYAIDRAIPEVREGRHGALIAVACGYLG
ncbi:MAG TPA: ABC transporter ATP-binding protein, partial [Streptomyces sp.]